MLQAGARRRHLSGVTSSLEDTQSVPYCLYFAGPSEILPAETPLQSRHRPSRAPLCPDRMTSDGAGQPRG